MNSPKLAALLFAAVTAIGCGGNGGGNGGNATTPLSQAEVDSLTFTREEEKLARDVYDALGDYGAPFTNIVNSEQNHMDAVKTLLDRYDLDDPAATTAKGEFVDSDLAALYTDLVNQGKPAELAALAVGCAIEELDIHDVEFAEEGVTHTDILSTYDNLLLGSRNHLRAFHGKLTSLGGSYTPQYIDQATFDSIVNSPQEKPGR